MAFDPATPATIPNHAVKWTADLQRLSNDDVRPHEQGPGARGSLPEKLYILSISTEGRHLSKP
jgi:hypothetical protein